MTPWLTHCPTCRKPMHHNHRCPGAPARELPCPPPANLRELIAQARREANAPTPIQETIPMTTDDTRPEADEIGAPDPRAHTTPSGFRCHCNRPPASHDVPEGSNRGGRA